MDKLPTTIKECHQVIRLLLTKLDDLSRRFDTLEVENKKLRVGNAQLKERLNNNSSNSSLLPSKSFKQQKNNRQPSGKKAGGQPGHKGHHRALLPIEQVDVIQVCALPTACWCGDKITPADKYVRHQVYELPVLKLDITEYQLEQGYGEGCCCRHVASLPEGVT